MLTPCTLLATSLRGARLNQSHLTLPADNAAILNTTISEGNDLSIQFSLGFTLICPENDPNCRVLILLDNQRPDELVLSVRDSLRATDSV